MTLSRRVAQSFVCMSHAQQDEAVSNIRAEQLNADQVPNDDRMTAGEALIGGAARRLVRVPSSPEWDQSSGPGSLEHQLWPGLYLHDAMQAGALHIIQSITFEIWAMDATFMKLVRRFYEFLPSAIFPRAGDTPEKLAMRIGSSKFFDEIKGLEGGSRLPRILTNWTTYAQARRKSWSDVFWVIFAGKPE